jgi:hypothetical protein
VLLYQPLQAPEIADILYRQHAKQGELHALLKICSVIMAKCGYCPSYRIKGMVFDPFTLLYGSF